MSTRISAGIGDHSCFLFFITMIPIDCKIINFSLYLFVRFFERSPVISWHAPNKLLVENPLASTLCIHSFSAMKSISIINLAITENMQYTIVKAY